ncbi:hypothetical protein MKK51_05505 [Methylobacterium sp. E-045]|nr:hypothetical protein [Methylobacterium sp. E-045]MCJ2128303.1 hypothetical protein [Methylobacterium sp. E-045]
MQEEGYRFREFIPRRCVYVRLDVTHHCPLPEVTNARVKKHLGCKICILNLDLSAFMEPLQCVADEMSNADEVHLTDPSRQFREGLTGGNENAVDFYRLKTEVEFEKLQADNRQPLLGMGICHMPRAGINLCHSLVEPTEYEGGKKI